MFSNLQSYKKALGITTSFASFIPQNTNMLNNIKYVLSHLK